MPEKPNGMPTIVNVVGGNSWIILASMDSKCSSCSVTFKDKAPISVPSNGILALWAGKVAATSSVNSDRAESAPAGLAKA